MSRPRKKPSIVEQMRSLIAQALEEKRFDMVHGLISILKSEEAPVQLPDQTGQLKVKEM